MPVLPGPVAGGGRGGGGAREQRGGQRKLRHAARVRGQGGHAAPQRAVQPPTAFRARARATRTAAVCACHQGGPGKRCVLPGWTR